MCKTLIDLFRDRRGNIAIITAFTLIPITLAAGGGLDLMTHEMRRAELQDALDRGVLAASALSQTKDARTVIDSYLADTTRNEKVTLDVTETKKLNFHRVEATASYDFPTNFLKLARIDHLTVPASSVAEEKRSNIELSLILDISGSMVGNGGMKQLKPAAKSFIDTMLTKETKDTTTISLVPFAGNVNIGASAYDFLAGNGNRRKHDQSSCFELQASDFGDGFPDFTKRDQVPRFTYYGYGKTDRQPWWCPTEESAISYFSNDASALKTKVDNLQPFDGTGTAYALKWGYLLLDPIVRPYVKYGAAAGYIQTSSKAGDRPANYDDPDTLKFMVLMTDGEIIFQPRPKPGQPDPLVAPQNSNNFNFLFGSTPNGAGNTIWGQYDNLCKVAKAKGIRIFTVAFKVQPDIASKLAKCATSASDAYKIDGLDMSEAFKSIATSIQRIKLVSQ